jgi:putative phage-type endonuclease
MIDTTLPNNPAADHAVRASGIGSSDAAVIMGASPWKTPSRLYREKRGEADQDPENDAMFFGQLLEDDVAVAYVRATGNDAIERDQITRRMPGHPYIMAHCDYVELDHMGRVQRVIEIKTTSADAYERGDWGPSGTTQIPRLVWVQVQHQLMVTDCPVADVAVMIGGQRVAVYRDIPADREFHEALLAACAEFWRRVQEGDAPPVDYNHPATTAEIKAQHPEVEDITIPLPPRAQELHNLLVAIKADRDTLDKAEGSSKAELLAMMGQARIGLLPDGGSYVRRFAPETVVQYTRKEYVDFRYSPKGAK